MLSLYLVRFLIGYAMSGESISWDTVLWVAHILIELFLAILCCEILTRKIKIRRETMERLLSLAHLCAATVFLAELVHGVLKATGVA